MILKDFYLTYFLITYYLYIEMPNISKSFNLHSEVMKLLESKIPIHLKKGSKDDDL